MTIDRNRIARLERLACQQQHGADYDAEAFAELIDLTTAPPPPDVLPDDERARRIAALEKRTLQ